MHQIQSLIEQRQQYLDWDGAKFHYLIIDSCLIEQALAKLYRIIAEPQMTLLYAGTEHATLLEISPILLQLSEDDYPALEPLLLTIAHQRAGLILAANVNLELLADHLRRYLTAKNGQGERSYFRFYDPTAWCSAWASHSLAPITDNLITHAWLPHWQQTLPWPSWFKLNAPIPLKEGPHPLRLSQQLIERSKHCQLLYWLGQQELIIEGDWLTEQLLLVIKLLVRLTTEQGISRLDEFNHSLAYLAQLQPQLLDIDEERLYQSLLILINQQRSVATEEVLFTLTDTNH